MNILLANIINIICQVLSWALVIRSILSWFVYSGTVRNPGIQKGYEILSIVTEPIVMPFRKLLGRYGSSGVDFSPLLALVAIYIIRRLLISLVLI